MNRYEEMLPEDFLAEVERLPVFFIPAGLLEWHADHLPLGQDALKAYGICGRAAEKLGGGIVLPPVYFGRPGYSSYAGTLTFSEACTDLLFTELFGELRKVGARVIVLITGHYGPCQVDFIKRVSAYFMKANPDIEIIAQPEYEGVEIDGEVPADHAGKWETSMFWHLHPELTHMEKFAMVPKRKKLYPNPPNRFYDEGEDWTWKSDLRKTASRELGERAIEAISTAIVERIHERLRKMNLETDPGSRN
jgi:creatinine amidohydrolase